MDKFLRLIAPIFDIVIGVIAASLVIYIMDNMWGWATLTDGQRAIIVCAAMIAVAIYRVSEQVKDAIDTAKQFQVELRQFKRAIDLRDLLYGLRSDRLERVESRLKEIEANSRYPEDTL